MLRIYDDMKICFDNVFEPSLPANKEPCDLYLFNYHRTVFFHRDLGISYVVKGAKELSYRTNTPVILYAKMDVEGEISRSAIVVAGGRIIGVADSLSERGDERKALRVFRFGKVKFGVVVGRDPICAGIDNAFAAGAVGILHVTSDPFDLAYCRAYRAHNVLTGAGYFGLFADCAVFVDERIRLFGKSGTEEVAFQKQDRACCGNFLKISFD